MKRKLSIASCAAGIIVLLCSLCIMSCAKNYASDEEEVVENKTEDVQVQWKSTDFMRGVDVSCLYDIEKKDGKFYDTDGSSKDMLQILANHGVNWIRIRIWNDPENAAPTSTYNYGMCTASKAQAIAKRAKKIGLQVLLDFHYSDTWTDPGHQLTPKAWDGFSTVEELSSAAAKFTSDTIASMIKDGARPDMVQIGNEINPGLMTKSSVGGTAKVPCTKGSANYVAVLNACAAAVKSCDTKNPIGVMLHFAEGGDTSKIKGFLDSSTKVNYDVVGLSYYPFFTSHKTIEGLGNTVKMVTGEYKKLCVVAETSFPYIMDQTQWDSVQNVCWWNGDGDATLAKAYANLQGVIQDYSIKTQVYGSDTVITPSEANQKRVLKAVIDATSENGGSGVFYWGGEWIWTDKNDANQGSTWENQTLFHYLKHNPLKAFEAFEEAAELTVPSYGENDVEDEIEDDETNIVVADCSYTATGNYILIADASEFNGIDNISQIKITASNIAGSAQWNFWYGYGNSNEESGVTWIANLAPENPGVWSLQTGKITGTALTSVLEGGLYLAGNEGLTCSTKVEVE